MIGRDGTGTGITGHLQRIAIWRIVSQATVLMFVAWVLSVSGCNRQSYESGESVDAFSAHLDQHVPALLKRYGVPGVSMAIVRKGQLAWSAAYGYADRAQGRELTVDAVFRVESISKSVTAWGVMRLVEQGLVRLDAPVQQYLGRWELPVPANERPEITVRRLLSNSGGMPLGSLDQEYAPQHGMPSLTDYLSQQVRIVSQPGAGFIYSNVGFNLLELLVEEVSGRDFAAFMADEVLVPLGMQDSSFAWLETLRAAMPVAYDLNSKPVPLYVYPASAAGGLLAPVEDIALFVGAAMTGASFIDHGVLRRESIRQLHTQQVDIPGLYGLVADGYGFGHFVEWLPDGRQAVWHGGQGHGWMTHFHMVPESGDAIVILTNSQRSWPLMAQVLSDWARWSGFGPVKMCRISYGIIGLQALVGVIVSASLWQAYRLIKALRRGERRWVPLSQDFRIGRLLQAASAIGAVALLAWGAAQPYLMVSSIFPGVVVWAGWACFVLAVAVFLSAIFPRTDEHST